MTEIVFEALEDSPDTVGDGVAVLSALQVIGFQTAQNFGICELRALTVAGAGALTTAQLAEGVAELPPLEVFAFQGAGAHGVVTLPALTAAARESGALAPVVGGGDFDLPALVADGVGATARFGAGGADLPALDVRAFEAGGNFGTAELPTLGVIAYETLPLPVPRFMLQQPPGFTAGYASTEWLVRASDGLLLTGAMSELHTVILRAKLALEADPSMRFEGTRTLRDTLTLESQLGAVYHELLTVSLALGATQTITFTAVAQMVDALLLGGTVSGAREAYALITEAIAFGALLDAVSIATLTAGLSFDDTIAAAYTAAARLVDELLLQAAMTPSVTLVALLEDELALGLGQTITREAFAALRDRLDFVMQVNVDDEQYIAWSMNTDSRAASKYTNYPFNSFFKVGGRYYGVADTGLKRLGGPDDDGEAIGAKLRLGMSSLGTRRQKRIASGYLGYTSSGDLRLKVIVADSETGEREAHTYRLYVTGASSQREGRIKVGKGLKAAYYDFQIENVDGADFDLDVIEILPIVLESRLRGNAGAKP